MIRLTRRDQLAHAPRRQPSLSPSQLRFERHHLSRRTPSPAPHLAANTSALPSQQILPVSIPDHPPTPSCATPGPEPALPVDPQTAAVIKKIDMSKDLLRLFYEDQEALPLATRARYTRQLRDKQIAYFQIRRHIESFFRNPDTTIDLASVTEAIKIVQPSIDDFHVQEITTKDDLWGILLALQWEQRLADIIKNNNKRLIRHINIDCLWKLCIDRYFHSQKPSFDTDARYFYEDEIGYLGGHYRGWFTIFRWLLEGQNGLTAANYNLLHTAAVCDLRETERDGRMFMLSFRDMRGNRFGIIPQGPGSAEHPNATEDGLQALRTKVATDPEWWDGSKIDAGKKAELICHHLPAATIQAKVEAILAAGTERIAKAPGPREKITAIVELVQELEQRHPFSDGNCRTNNMFLNYLLLRENIYPTIIPDPNMLDAYSVPELVAAVIDGQRYFQREMLR